MADTTVSISLAIGFGCCTNEVPVSEPDGARSLTFRYLPAGLWHPDVAIIRALINGSAFVFPQFDLFPPDLIPNVPPEGAARLSPQGAAFYESCPVYAKLTLKEPWMTWEQHHPEGGVAWSIRASGYEPMIDTVLREWPISVWARKFLEPWEEILPPNPKHGPVAMHMQRPLPEDKNQEVDEEGWISGDLGNSVADVHERVEAPFGLHKVLLVSCDEDRVKDGKEKDYGDQFRLIPCALAVRKAEGEPFNWREHHVWRIEQAVQFLPRALKWTEDEKVAHPGAWGAKCLMPCYKWDMPEIKFQANPEGAGWDVIGLVYKPLSEMDLPELASYEHDFVELNRQQRGH